MRVRVTMACQECKRRNIGWITRGSAADSLVCYCLGISGVCPIRFDLYFRRFLNKERMALHQLPDIDPSEFFVIPTAALHDDNGDGKFDRLDPALGFTLLGVNVEPDSAGAVDWLCWPRFDSEACFAALLGASGHGAVPAAR